MVRMHEHRIKEGDRVRIRNEVDPSLYQGWSTMGNEGIAKAVREDRFGLPEIFIEWDKNHWTYNHAPDGWTFEDHFDVITKEEEKMSDSEQLNDLVAKLLGRDKSDEIIEEISATPIPQFDERTESSLGERLNSLLGQADEANISREQMLATVAEYLPDAEAFVLVGVQRKPHPQSEKGVLIPYAIMHADSDESELMAMSQISALAAHAYQELALLTITQLTLKRQQEES